MCLNEVNSLFSLHLGIICIVDEEGVSNMWKREKKENCIEKILVIVLFLVLIMTFGFFSNEKCHEKRNEINILTDGWYYIKDDGERVEVNIPGIVNSTEESLILYNENLKEEDSGQVISVKAARYDIEISYNDELIYQYNDEKFPRNDQMKSNFSCTGKLPVVKNGGILKLKFHNTQKGNYNLSEVYIGRERELILKQFKEAIFPIGISIIMIALSVFAIGAGMYLKTFHVEDKRFINVALFLIVCSIWCVTDSSILQQYSNHYHVNSTISFCAFMLLAVPMLRFIRNTENIGKYRILGVLINLFYVNTIAQCVLNYFGCFEYIEMLFVTHILLTVGCVIITVIILREYRMNKTAEIETIVFAFIILAASGVLAMILYWILKIYYYSSIFETGILIFVALLLRGIILTAVTNLRAKTEIEVLKRLAKEDRLTGIGNRHAFDEYINILQAEAATLKNALMIFIDINFLKATNDRYGHGAGDELIIATSKCIKNVFGESGAIFRIGGDEFCIILKNPIVDEQEWYEALEREVQLYNRDSRILLSIAEGGSYLREIDGKIKTISDWKYQADQAMYEDKRRKRRK